MVIWVAVLPRVYQLTEVMPNFWRAVYLKSIFCVYDIKYISWHDTAISQIYGYQNWVHEPRIK